MKFFNLISSRWGTIVSTAVVLTAIFTFFHSHTVNLKNEQINTLKEHNSLLERKIKDLSEHGPFPQAAQKINESINEIQKQLIPLATLYKFDPLSAMVELGVEGGMRAIFSTEISLKLRESFNYIKQKKYDLASKLADNIEKEIPDFPGVDFIRFLINNQKGESYSEDTLKYANSLVEKVYINTLSEGSRSNMKLVYKWLIEYYIGAKKKQRAEEIALKAIEYWPDLRPFFEKNFGYSPTLK